MGDHASGSAMLADAQRWQWKGRHAVARLAFGASAGGSRLFYARVGERAA